MDGPLLKAASL